MDSPAQDLQARLADVVELIEKQRVVQSLVDRQHGPRSALERSLVHRQHDAALARKLRTLHAADIAYLLETLTPDRRVVVWECLPDDAGGDVLLELTPGVAEALLEHTSSERLFAMVASLPVDDIGELAEVLPPERMEEVYRNLDAGTLSRVKASIAYPEDTVGYDMSEDQVTVPVTATVKQALRALRARGEIPEQTDQLFVVDERQRLVGSLPLTTMLLNRFREPVRNIMVTPVTSFTSDESTASAARAFERYDLVSAPVVDGRHRVVGRLTVDDMVDFVREQADADALKREGLHEDEDLLAPVWRGARRRWYWLGLNLLTAFVASRVIGIFDGSIEKLVALATLMPIVASVGGNTGNQTVALVVRGLALEQINRANLRYIAFKEVGIGVINGLLWGGVMGAVAFALYWNPMLGVVMGVATLLNLVVAAAAGIVVPLALRRAGKDPALGSSVLLTFTTDSMGFLIFLGLATLALLG